MNTEPIPVTPATQGRKRELTSPEFDIDLKKNKLLSVTPVSEPISVFDLETENLESANSEIMASNTASTSSTEQTTSHILILQSEMQKLSAMLKDTFKGETVGVVKGIVEGVLEGIQEQILKAENINKELMGENQQLRKSQNDGRTRQIQYRPHFFKAEKHDPFKL